MFEICGCLEFFYGFDSLRLVCFSLRLGDVSPSFYCSPPCYIGPVSVISLFKWWETKNLNILVYCPYGLFVAVLVFSKFYATCDRQGSKAVHSNNLGDFFPLFSLNDNKKENCYFAFFF